MKRVVVTGMGMVSPLGRMNKTWERILNDESAIIRMKDVPEGMLRSIPNENVCIAMAKEEQDIQVEVIGSRVNSFIANSAADCLMDSGLIQDRLDKNIKHVQPHRIGVDIGAISGNVTSIQNSVEKAVFGQTKDYSKIPRLTLLHMLNNMGSSFISQKYKMQGANISTGAACATGLASIINACRLIQLGQQDVMLAGAGEETVNDLVLHSSLKIRAISNKYYHDPRLSSRPFNKERSGFVLGEGAGILVVEELDHALDRGAKIYAEILSYAQNSDAYHLTQPLQDGKMAFECMKQALNNDPSFPLDLVNAHATSTQVGDQAELMAIHKLSHFLQNRPLVATANKGHIGHCFSAAGAIETILTILSLSSSQIPKIANLNNSLSSNYEINKDSQQMSLDLDESLKKSQVQLLHDKCNMNVNYALKNSFGFGGTNSSILLSKYNS